MNEWTEWVWVKIEKIKFWSPLDVNWIGSPMCMIWNGPLSNTLLKFHRREPKISTATKPTIQIYNSCQVAGKRALEKKNTTTDTATHCWPPLWFELNCMLWSMRIVRCYAWRNGRSTNRRGQSFRCIDQIHQFTWPENIFVFIFNIIFELFSREFVFHSHLTSGGIDGHNFGFVFAFRCTVCAFLAFSSLTVIESIFPLCFR